MSTVSLESSIQVCSSKGSKGTFGDSPKVFKLYLTRTYGECTGYSRCRSDSSRRGTLLVQLVELLSELRLI